MCGIFGFVTNSESGLDLTSCRRILIDLFHRSEPRGRDASGLVLVSSKTAQVYKKPLPPDRFLSNSGFSEFDTFRSQQIRAGLIDRDTALKLAHKDNQYDMATLKEFMGQVGLNLEEVLTRIGEIPKLS